jgi:NDP-sugar pyrophosphorylase family protein
MNKERLTITLDKKVLSAVDETIDGINVRNRSHAIERLIELALLQNTSQKAVILAGGDTILSKGKRTPKSMVMAGGLPLLEYTIRMLSKNNTNDIVILAGENSEEISNYFGDGSSFGVRITYVVENKRRGTEGALFFARGLVGHGPFFVLNGDNYYDFNIAEMYKQHIITKALVTIALTTVEKTTGFGVTRLDGSRILDFVEKPAIEGSKLVSTGFYVFSNAALDLISKSDKPVMLERSLFPRLASMGKLHGYVVSGKWIPFDLGRLEAAIKGVEALTSSR